MSELHLSFGAMSPKLRDQLANWQMPDEKVAVWQRMADSVVTLHIWGHVTDSEAHKIRARIHKFIGKEIGKIIEKGGRDA